MRRIFVLILMLICVSLSSVNALTLKDARALYSEGKFGEALPIFEKEYKKKPKDGSINHWLGVCLFEVGRADEAIKYLEYADTRKVIESSHYLARIYFNKYDFSSCVEMYEKYIDQLENNNKEVNSNIFDIIKKAKIAQSMLNHVEKITIIDSIVVDKKDFFKSYNISPETGTLVGFNSLPIKVENSTVGFQTQSEDRILWAMPDETDKLRLVESVKLINGKWDTPQFLSDELNNNGDVNYPFILQDGTTLYYASNGDESIGGYDIFMTRIDNETGEYFNPQNIGMPYNSFYDDYLLVLDEVTGIGWWATDRNQIPEKLTIYVFVKNSIRENYREDEANLISFAKITNYRETWNDNDYSSLKSKLYQLNTNTSDNSADFVFSVRKGEVYTSFSDFKSDEALKQMEKLIQLYEKMSSLKTNLERRRCHYNIMNDELKDSIKDDILNLEQDKDSLEDEIFRLENQIREIEQNYK